MDVTWDVVGGVTIIRPECSHLDASRSKEFRREVVERLSRGMHVLLDLSHIQFVDSSGCGAVLACSRKVDPDGDGHEEVKLCGVTRAVRSVFQMVRLHKVLEIYNDRDEALRAFADVPDQARAEG